MKCLEYGDPRLRMELWVDEHQHLYYKEGCRCATCVAHHAGALKTGRCSQFCTMCFDALMGTFTKKRDTHA